MKDANGHDRYGARADKCYPSLFDRLKKRRSNIHDN
jgi:hypothetical protein